MELEVANGGGINDLPNEILEYILSLLLPYEDLQSCMLVCKRWHFCGLNVIHHTKLNFHKAIVNFGVHWRNSDRDSQAFTITKRYSHSACSHDNSMYVFGGCTCTSTTFNDLWRLDLSTRNWVRLLTMGSYPSPKACASLVYHKGTLVLFGGWTHPSPYPLHQASRTFNELHIYYIEGNRWCSIPSPTVCPPPMAGHTATVHGDCMIVFGGLQGHNGGSNDVWCFDFNSLIWAKKETTEAKPHPRYGHSQIAIDEDHLFILGGWGGPPNMVMNDVWLLTMTGRVWVWTPIQVHNSQWAASHLWCHPACKVDDYVVVLSRNPESSPTPLAYSRWTANAHIGANPSGRRLSPDNLRRVDVEPPANQRSAVDRDVNINGRRGSLLRNVEEPPQASRNVPEPDTIHRPPAVNNLHYVNHMVAFREDRLTSHRNRDKQLDAIKRMEDRLKTIIDQLMVKPVKRPNPPKSKPPKMAMFVLDTTQILNATNPSVSWLPIRAVADGSPDATILYTLVKGKGELIMFGGIKKDANALTNQLSQLSSDASDTVSNSLHFIAAPYSTI